MNREFPELHEFFGAYFHQDWLVEHGTAEQVLDAFLSESASEDLILVQNELNTLIDQGMAESALRRYMLADLSCYYCYWFAWESGDVWLRHIASRLADRLSRT